MNIKKSPQYRISLLIFLIPFWFVIGVSQTTAASYDFWEASPKIGEDEFVDESQADNYNLDLEKNIYQQLDIYYESQGLDSKREQSLNQVNHGIDLLKKGKKKEGLNVLSKAWELNPKLVSPGIFIALVHLQDKEYEKVIETTQKLKRHNPKFFKSYVIEGVAYIQLKKQDKAKAEFVKAYELNPGEPEVNNNLATIALLEGDTNKAKELYEEILDKDPENLNALELLAQVEEKLGNKTKSILLLEQAIDNDQGTSKSYISLTKLYLTNGENQKALNLVNQAQELFPNDNAIKELAGLVLFQNASYNEAIKVLKALAQSGQASATTYNILAMSYEQSGKYEQALLEIQKGIDLENSHAPSKFVKARLLAKLGEYEKSKEILHHLVDEFPKRTESLELLARIAIQQNRVEDAENLFKQALKIQERRTLNLQLALLQLSTGNKKDAFANLNNWVKKYPGDMETRIIYADSLFIHGEYSQAEKQYMEILKTQPDRVSTINNLAIVLSKQGKYDPALKYAQRAHVLLPENPMVMDTLGMAYLYNKNLELAGKWLNKSASLMKDNPSINYHLSLYLIQVGDEEKAKKILKTIVEKDSNFEEYSEAKKLLDSL